MITEDYVSFETAKLLLEKGYPFNDCWNWYTDFDNISSSNDDEGNGEIEINECHYPLISLGVAMKWLRKEHHLNIIADCYTDHAEARIMTIEDLPACKCRGIIEEKYEKACEAAIKYCLENLI